MFDSVGLIGVGQMGTPMVRRLLEAGYHVLAHDIDPEAFKRAHDLGAETAPSPRVIGERCNPIITILPNSDIVREVVLGSEGVLEGAKEGDILIEMTTGYPFTTKQIAKRLKEKSVEIIDAPVSGGVVGAEKGTLSIMVGGDYNSVERCMPILKTLGKNIFHMGGIGAGHTMKAVNNFLSAASMVATSEALTLATKADLDPAKVIEVLQVSSGRNYATDFKFPKYVLTGEFNDGFRMELQNKDLKIFTDIGKDLGTPIFTASIIQQIISLAVNQGYGKRGHTSITEFIENWGGVKIRKID
jgi:3-hydroxyisobutyrate dehydrogenase